MLQMKTQVILYLYKLHKLQQIFCRVRGCISNFVWRGWLLFSETCINKILLYESCLHQLW